MKMRELWIVLLIQIIVSIKLLSNGIMVVIEECCLRKKPSIRLNDVKNASEEITIYMRITEIIRV